jgi:hypothetical protein
MGRGGGRLCDNRLGGGGLLSPPRLSPKQQLGVPDRRSPAGRPWCPVVSACDIAGADDLPDAAQLLAKRRRRARMAGARQRLAFYRRAQLGRAFRSDLARPVALLRTRQILARDPVADANHRHSLRRGYRASGQKRCDRGARRQRRLEGHRRQYRARGRGPAVCHYSIDLPVIPGRPTGFRHRPCGSRRMHDGPRRDAAVGELRRVGLVAPRDRTFRSRRGRAVLCKRQPVLASYTLSQPADPRLSRRRQSAKPRAGRFQRVRLARQSAGRLSVEFRSAGGTLLAAASRHQHDPQPRLAEQARVATAQGRILHRDAPILRVRRSRSRLPADPRLWRPGKWRHLAWHCDGDLGRGG